MQFVRFRQEGLAIAMMVAAICSYVFFALNTRLWVTRTDAATIQARWQNGKLGMNGDHALFAATSTESVATFPASVDAVVVPAAFLTPDHNNISRTYEERLIAGYRYALLSGAPVLILSGSSEACELAKHFLLTSQRVLPRLFMRRFLASLSESANATAMALKTALTSSSGMPWSERGDVEEDGTAVPSVGRTLEQVLRSAPLHPDYRRFMASRFTTSVPVGVRDGTLARRAKTDSTTALLAALAAGRGAAEPHTNPDRGERVVSYGAEADAAFLSDTVWPVGHAADIASFPRVLHHNGHEYVLSGIAFAENEARDEAEDVVAHTLYDLAQQSAVGLALNAEAGQASHMPPIAQAMLWLNDSRHVVIVVSSSSDQQYVKLLHRQALRRAEQVLQDDFHRAQRELRKMQLREARQFQQQQQQQQKPPRYSLTDAPSEDPLRLRFDVLVTPPLVEQLESPLLDPTLLPFTGLLPEDAIQDACGLAKWLGKYSHYLYENYRRIADAVIVRVASAAQVDELQLLLDVLRKVDKHKISLVDVLQ